VQANVTRHQRHRARRAGFTTVELLIVLVIGGIVAASIGGVLRRQQRFFTNAAVLVERRVSLRDATGILPAEMRALSPASGDVIAFSDSSLEMRATVGAAIVCDTLPNGAALDLAPVRATRSNQLAAFSTTPQAGDVALVFDPGASTGASDDAWVALPVNDVVSATTSCATSPFVDPAAEASLPRLRLRLTTGTRTPATVGPGAFVHVLRRVRYRLYRTSTSEWYLGYSEWDGTAYTVVQPVSGPFAPYSKKAGTSGLMLRYVDETDAPITLVTDASRIARIEVVARTELERGLSGEQLLVDSQVVAVRVRNR
jgi:prepilin-type N-terminal cleavage/methylation domain-containing protein